MTPTTPDPILTTAVVDLGGAFLLLAIGALFLLAVRSRGDWRVFVAWLRSWLPTEAPPSNVVPLVPRPPASLSRPAAKGINWEKERAVFRFTTGGAA